MPKNLSEICIRREEKQLIFDIYNTEVVWDDTQTKEDAAVIVERFNKTEKFYKNKNVAGAEFKVYQDVGHEFNAAKITEDIVQFFEKIQ